MKSLLLVSLSFIFTACVSNQKVSTTASVARTIASDSGTLLINGYHSGRLHPVTVEDIRVVPEYLKETFGVDNINFKILNETPDANGRIYFSFEVDRANAGRIVDHAIRDLRAQNTGVQRTRAQNEHLQRVTECMIANYTVSNFLNEFSASDAFQFRFNVPESVRDISLHTGVLDPAKPTCDRWSVSAFDN